jgi:hypothetical protein
MSEKAEHNVSESTEEEAEERERSYLRHPANIPIQYAIEDAHAGSEEVYNISKGGLCFSSDEPLPVGVRIRIALNLGDMDAAIEGVVAWVVKKEYSYDIGVKFLEDQDVFHFRLIEQVCSIAHYRNDVREKEGREISNEEAAIEWINKYAASYPDMMDH